MKNNILKSLGLIICLYLIFENFSGNKFWLVVLGLFISIGLFYQIRLYKFAIVHLAHLFDTQQNITRENIQESLEAILDKMDSLEEKIDCLERRSNLKASEF